jgi:AAA domain, putative AbiEii toxin, Type IV TA system
MLKSLKIKNFRCFKEFKLPQLGRVNLLVGKNNSGKTSILEAVQILTSPNTIKPFLDIVKRRQEYSWGKDSNIASFNFRHLLHGHPSWISTTRISFEVLGTDDHNGKVRFSSHFTDIPPQELFDREQQENKDIKILNLGSDNITGTNNVLKWEGIDKSVFLVYWPSSTQIEMNLPEMMVSQFVSLNFSDLNTVIAQFNQIVLTPQEEILYESLRIIEPGIERIAPISAQGYHSGSGGFLVSINQQRVPIGSMGYGIWRMLEITLAMVNIPSGTLLIDEIDTGLHFSVMIDLWKLICKTAEKLDIQVFATTHNSDCWKSLAEVANSDDVTSEDITIHRIERGQKESIVFNEQEIAITAERDIEVR